MCFPRMRCALYLRVALRARLLSSQVIAQEFGDSTVLDSAEAVIHQAVEEAMAVGDPTSDAWRAAVAATDKITQVIERGRKDGSSSSSSSSSGHAAARAARHDADAGDDEDDDEELLAEVDHEDTERDVTCPLTKKVFEFPVRMRCVEAWSVYMGVSGVAFTPGCG